MPVEGADAGGDVMTTPCIDGQPHYWLLPTTATLIVTGVCQRCGRSREMRGLLPDVTEKQWHGRSRKRLTVRDVK